MNRIINFRSSKVRMFLLGVVDVFTIIIHSFLAIIMRHEWRYAEIPQRYINSIKQYMVISIITTILIFIAFKLYQSVWSYASMNEAFLIVMACVLSTAFQGLGMEIFALDVPRSYYPLYFFLLTMTTLGSRFSYRIFQTLQQKMKKTIGKRINTMVIGAGEAGSVIIHELKSSSHLNHHVVCIIDDNQSKIGKYLHGVPIVGGREMILAKTNKYKVDEIILAIPSLAPSETKEILELCSQTTCKLRTVPGMYQLITDEVSVAKLKEVSIEDLLGRESMDIDLASVLSDVKGKTVLITGGGGSIGSELCRQIANYSPKCLIIFDIYENNAYDIQQELKKKHKQLHLEVLIGSVRNAKRIEFVMEHYHPDIVYHAAAHKHVPLMEDSPNEAIKNNVFGTYNTARAADKYNVSKFVLISTDKAVNPTNIMGASKRICEMLIQIFSRHSKTEYVAVRFGNVLGSNGSVIPLFKKQIEQGGPVTVTDPEVVRYFMTIPEAVSLVLQAGAYAKGGEIFVLDMGAPVKIVELAKKLIRLSGYTLGVDMEIEYTGLRPGEKLYEELLIEEEGLQKTKNKSIFIGRPLEFNEVHFLSELRELEQMVLQEKKEVKQLVSQIVPSYHIRTEDKHRDAELLAKNTEHMNKGKD